MVFCFREFCCKTLVFFKNFVRRKVRITKAEISMRAWRAQMSAAPYGAFVVIPEISERYFLHKKKSETDYTICLGFLLNPG